jgi:hypothetical protein
MANEIQKLYIQFGFKVEVPYIIGDRGFLFHPLMCIIAPMWALSVDKIKKGLY